MVTARHNGP